MMAEKARVVEPEETAVARLWLGKCVSMAKHNRRRTVGSSVFC
jgi:hypothetical protein